MNVKDYQKAARRTLPTLGTTQADLIHMTMGLSTESNELLDIMKKNLAYGKPIDIPNMREEIGDIAWYLINLCTICEFEFEEILQTNIDKLKARYPEKFTEERAINRDLSRERRILEELGFSSGKEDKP